MHYDCIYLYFLFSAWAPSNGFKIEANIGIAESRALFMSPGNSVVGQATISNGNNYAGEKLY